MPNSQKLSVLTEMREAKRITLEQMAHYCGLFGSKSRETVGKWERGQNIPNSRRRSKFITYLSDHLELKSNREEFQKIWKILVEEWNWEPLSADEWRQYFSPVNLNSAKITVETVNGVRKMFLIPKHEIAFGMAKRAREPVIDLTLRILPCRSRVEDPENWGKSAMISKIHGWLKVVDGKIFIKDESRRNGIFIQRIIDADTELFDSLGEWAELYGTADEGDSDDHPLVKISSGEWIQIPRRININLGHNLLQLRLDAFWGEKDQQIEAVRISRLSNCSQHEYLQLIRRLYIGSSHDCALNIKDASCPPKAAEIMVSDGRYYLRRLAEGQIKFKEKSLPLNPISLEQGAIFQIGPITLHFDQATDEDFLTP